MGPELARRIAALGWRRGLSRCLSLHRGFARVDFGRVPCWLDFSVPQERHLFLGAQELELFQLYRSWVRPGDTVVDVGANAGFHTAVLADLVGPSGRVIAIEPNPELQVRLDRVIAHNPLANVELLQVAVSDHEGFGQLYIPGRNHGESSLLREWCPDSISRTVRVPLRRLDGVLDEVHAGNIRLLKLDVEGHEAPALSGLSEALARGSVETLVFEVSPQNVAVETPRLCAEIAAYGYEVFGITGYGLVPLHALDDALSQIGPGYNLFARRSHRVTRTSPSGPTSITANAG